MQEKDPSINDLILLQPKSVTFGQYDISEWQENILTLITESLQKHLTKEKPLNTDLFGEPYIVVKCDEAGGTNNKAKVIASAKDLISKVFSFQWKSKNGKNVKSTGTIITTIHDIEGSNNLTINFNKWAIPFLLYYGEGSGGGLFSKTIALTLRGNMTKRIYKMISAYKDKTYYEYPIETFRKDFNVSKSYSNYLIGKKILEPAMKRIKESNSDVWFDYELKTKYKQNNGRKPKADTIVFKIKTTAATQGTDQFRRNETIRRWVDIAFDHPTDNKTITTTDKIISSDKCDMFYNKCIYYDDQITAGKMTTQHVKNTLLKILRDEFNIR
jgi:hypothetical protein